MKLTKYEHACFTVEKDNQLIVIDPGALSKDFVVTNNIKAIVVTHSHPDHFDPNTLADIFAKNPDSLLISTQEVVEKMVDHTSKLAIPNEKFEIGPFSLEFFGGKHATIYQQTPDLDNVGVLINKKVYYPGDSLTIPKVPVDTLAIPLGAPWLKTSEAIDFLLAVEPRQAFPTHDAVLSNDGQAFNDAWLQRFADPAGIKYVRINGQSIEI